MVKVEIKGLKELNVRLNPKRVVTEVDAEVKAAGKEFAKLANQSAAAQFGDKGILLGGIQPIKNPPFLQSGAESNARYSAYLEFGTIQHVNVPPDLKDYAIQFKGQGIRKTGGIIARPYFFPQQPIVQTNLIKRIKAIVEDI